MNRRILTAVAAAGLLALIGGGVWLWMVLADSPRAEPVDDASSSQMDGGPREEATTEPPRAPTTPRPSDDRDEREDVPPPPAEQPGDAPESSDDEEEPHETQDAADNHVVIVGRVVTASGEPVHGAYVLLAYEQMSESQFSQLTAGSRLFREDRGMVRTDAEGRFRMILGEWWNEGLTVPVAAPPPQSRYWTGRGEALDAARLEALQRDIQDRPAPVEVDAGEVTLPLGGTVRGRVVDTEGGPIAGATVRLAGNRSQHGSGDSAVVEYTWQERGPVATTDDDGRYRLVGMPETEAVIAARKRGYRQAVVEGVVAVSGEEVEVAEIVLPPAIEVTVRVTEANARPIEGARVRISYAHIRRHHPQRSVAVEYEAHTDERGEVHFDRIKHRRFTAIVDATGYVKEYRPRVVFDERLDIELTLRPETTIRFRPVDAMSGDALYSPAMDERVTRNLRLRYHRQDGERRHRHAVPLGWLEVEDDGTLVTNTAPAGEFEISFETRTHGTWTRQLFLEAGQTYDLGDISMEGGVRFVVEVFDPTGQPLPGSEVSTRQILRTERGFRSGSHDSGRTDEDGRWESQPVIGTHIGISARHPDWGKSYVEREVDPHVPTSTVRVTMSEPATIEGRVTDGSGEPVAGARVHLSAFEEAGTPGWRPPTARTNTDAQGQYAFTDVPAGAYLLSTMRIRTRSRSADSLPDVEVGPGEHVTFDLSTAIEFHGSLAWHSGALASNLPLELINMGEPNDDAVVVRARTDGQGRFTFNVEAEEVRGTYVLRVEAEHNRTFDLRVRLPREGGDVGELRLPNLSREFRVSLRIRLHAPHSDAPIRGHVRVQTHGMLTYSQGEYEQTEHIDWRLDVDGEVHLDDLPPAIYQVSLMEGATSSTVVATERIMLTPGEEGLMSLAGFPTGKVRLQVKLNGDSNAELFPPMARVEMTPAEEEALEESTFVPRNHPRTVTLTAGVEYTARFTAEGFESKRIQFTLTEGETKHIEVTLSPSE